MYDQIKNILTPDKQQELVWLPKLGVGYYPVDPLATPYDDAYYDKYVRYHSTELGQKLNEFRLGLVQKYIGDGPLIDIGVGCGSFVKFRRGETWGFDVNPAAIKSLKNVWRFVNSPGDDITNASFWDTLEHLQDPGSFVKNRVFVFISIPIFKSPEHVLGSRHFNRDEHYWYFTRIGLVSWFDNLGFELIESSFEEALLGREDIQTFVFKARKAA
jgi:hypothetical protein